MTLKDYYSILEIAPSSTGDEVRKAYRRLALIYHPDKNPGNPYAAAQFAEIKEAYETLIHPGKKDQYLQQRWYAKSTGQRAAQHIATPVHLLKLMLELDRHVRTLDFHRIDHEGLRDYLLNLLGDEHVKKTKSFNDPAINKEIIAAAIRSAQPLPIAFADRVAIQLRKLSAGDVSSDELIKQFIRQKRDSDYWDRKRPWLILLAVVLTSLLIYFMARNE